MFYKNSLYNTLIDQISSNNEAFRLANMGIEGFGKLLSTIMLEDEKFYDIKVENRLKLRGFGLRDDDVLTLQLTGVIFKADLFIYQAGKRHSVIRLDEGYVKVMDIHIYYEFVLGCMTFGSVYVLNDGSNNFTLRKEGVSDRKNVPRAKLRHKSQWFWCNSFDSLYKLKIKVIEPGADGMIKAILDQLNDKKVTVKYNLSDVLNFRIELVSFFMKCKNWPISLLKYRSNAEDLSELILNMKRCGFWLNQDFLWVIAEMLKKGIVVHYNNKCDDVFNFGNLEDNNYLRLYCTFSGRELQYNSVLSISRNVSHLIDAKDTQTQSCSVEVDFDSQNVVANLKENVICINKRNSFNLNLDANHHVANSDNFYIIDCFDGVGKLHVKKMQKDGNCMFWALTDQLIKLGFPLNFDLDHIRSFRQKIADFRYMIPVQN